MQQTGGKQAGGHLQQPTTACRAIHARQQTDPGRPVEKEHPARQPAPGDAVIDPQADTLEQGEGEHPADQPAEMDGIAHRAGSGLSAVVAATGDVMGD